MNRNVKQCPNAMIGLTLCARDVVARVTGRIQGWFRRSDREQLNRGLNLRLVERNAERARIAREWHNALFQSFLSMSLQLDLAGEPAAANSPDRHSPGQSPVRSLRMMHSVADEGRDFLRGLGSSGTSSMSLEQALSRLRDELTPGGGVRLRIFVKGQPKTLTPAIQEQIYLIGREAMLNALRHAQATSIEAEVEYLPRGLRLAVRDNGCGIDPQAVRSGRDSHWDLSGMRERAGSIGAKLRVWSRLGAGTEVEISVPGNIVAA
jgi:signal transduction histidine kinase